MVDRTNTDMQILKFLSVTKPSRRHEVKMTRRTHEIQRQRVSCTIPPLEARRSPSTVGAMSHSSSAVFCNIIRYTIHIRRKSWIFTTSKYCYFYEWHCNGIFWLQQPLTRVPCWPAGPTFQPMLKQLLPATARDHGWHE